MFPDPTCPECREELPERGWKVRAVPRLGGRVRRVCAACAERIDGQARLDVLARDAASAPRRQAGRSGSTV